MNEEFHEERRKKRDLIQQIRRRGRCSICNSGKLVEFHHLNRQTKYRSRNSKGDGIVAVVNQPLNFLALVEEIRKCALLCQQCHEWVEGKEKGTKWIPNFELDAYDPMWLIEEMRLTGALFLSPQELQQLQALPPLRHKQIG